MSGVDPIVRVWMEEALTLRVRVAELEAVLMSKLTMRQESQINEAERAGIKPARIAELIGCKEKQVLAVIEDYQRIRKSQADWTAVVEAEKAKDQ